MRTDDGCVPYRVFKGLVPDRAQILLADLRLVQALAIEVDGHIAVGLAAQIRPCKISMGTGMVNAGGMSHRPDVWEAPTSAPIHRLLPARTSDQSSFKYTREKQARMNGKPSLQTEHLGHTMAISRRARLTHL